MLGGALNAISRRLLRQHRAARCFERETGALGGVGASHDLGLKIVPVEKIVGSVGRWQNLRSDFFYRKGGVTQRFIRVGEAMRQGIGLPPIEVYRFRRPAGSASEQGKTEYYVVDGHHRVAMARKLGQDFLDANVKEFKVGETPMSDS